MDGFIPTNTMSNTAFDVLRMDGIDDPLINVNIGKTSALDDLENTMARLAEMQKNTLANGKASLQDMLEQKVVEAEVISE